MHVLLRVVSCLALLGTIGPPVAYAAGAMPSETMKLWMLVATIAWFATTPVWMGQNPSSDSDRSPRRSAVDPEGGRHPSPRLTS